MAAALGASCAGSRLHYRSHRSQALSGRTPRSVPTAVRSLAHSSQFHLTSWDSSKETSVALRETMTAPSSTSTSGSPRRQVVRMGNKATGGPFAPLVVVVRSALGEKEFNKFRGKAISAHSQVIKEFCKVVGVDNKQCQGVIRLAKKNGEWLGFLA